MCPPEEQTEPALSSRWRSIAGRQGTILPPHGPDLDPRCQHPPLSAIAWQTAADAAADRSRSPCLALDGATPASAGGHGSRRGGSAHGGGQARALLPRTRRPRPPTGIRLALNEAGCVLLDTRSAAGFGPALWSPAGSVRIRALAPGEEVRLGALFTRCFHVSRAGEEWRWRYRDHPHGGPWSSIAVAGDGEIVAHYGAYPVRLERREGERFRTLVAAQVGDLMSAPDLRGTGRGGTSLFARTGDHSSAAARRRASLRRAHRHQPCLLRTFAGAVRSCRAHCGVRESGMALARRTRALRLAGWRARRVAAPDARFDAFHERARHGYRLLARRDRRYLAWRYFSRPGRRYELHLAERGEELLGWAIFHREDGRLVWGDALVAPEAAAAAPLLLASALRTGESVTTVEGWFSPAAGWWQRALAETGFREVPTRRGCLHRRGGASGAGGAARAFSTSRGRQRICSERCAAAGQRSPTPAAGSLAAAATSPSPSGRPRGPAPPPPLRAPSPTSPRNRGPPVRTARPGARRGTPR